MLAEFSGSVFIKSIVKTFPINIGTIKSIVGICNNEFATYSVCPKCYAIYTKEQSTKVLHDGCVISETCSNILWPRHPQIAKQSPCGKILMKKVRSKLGNFFLYPWKVYVYQSLTTLLKKFISNNEFVQQCKKWKETLAEDNDAMKDIYDGKIWKEFQMYDGKPFLKDPNNFALLLNVDWFNPFKHTPGSVGAIYCAFANLPRELRFKRENVMLIGLIEGEPKHDLNSILKPAVDELLQLWKGIWISMKFVRVALICVACDIPAARKIAGFMGHNATRGCSRCLKHFSVSRCRGLLEMIVIVVNVPGRL